MVYLHDGSDGGRAVVTVGMLLLVRGWSWSAMTKTLAPGDWATSTPPRSPPYVTSMPYLPPKPTACDRYQYAHLPWCGPQLVEPRRPPGCPGTDGLRRGSGPGCRVQRAASCSPATTTRPTRFMVAEGLSWLSKSPPAWHVTTTSRSLPGSYRGARPPQWRPYRQVFLPTGWAGPRAGQLLYSLLLPFVARRAPHDLWLRELHPSVLG